MNTLAIDAEAAICSGDLIALGGVLNRNHEILRSLNLSTHRLEALCREARSAGALGAKITGAGGGGCMVALAAVAAASAAAIAASHGHDLAQEEIRDRVFAAAWRGHSSVAPQGSGADVAAATYGGFLWFRGRRGKPIVEPVDPPSSLVMLLIWTGDPVRTSDLLAQVSRLRAQEPKRHDRCMAALAEHATEFAHAFRSDHGRGIIRTARAYNACMGALGVAAQAPIVNTKLRRVAAWAESHGGAAKPSGAGGGDLAVAFFSDPNAAERFAEACL